jgi:hypothetical protein
MNKSLLTLTATAFLLATTMGTAQAQSTDEDDTMQRGQGMMQQGMQRGQRMMQQGMQRGQRMMQRGQRGERMMQRGRDGETRYGRYRDRDSDMRRHYRGRHGMGYGRGMGGGMGHGAMMQIVFAMMDADGNGSLSLQEVQDAHARIFAHMDANNDGELTKAEIRAFFRGGKDSRRSGWRDRSEMSDEMDDMDDADDLNLSDESGR